MVKKILIYNILFFTVVFLSFIYVVSQFIFNIENKISTNFSHFEFQKTVNETKSELNDIKHLIMNHYNFLKKHYYETQSNKILNEFEDLENLLTILNNLKVKNKTLLLNQLIVKNRLNIKIINLKNKIIASKNILEIGKTISLPCNPLKNYGLCKTEKNDKVYIVKYLPQKHLYLMSYFTNKLNSDKLIMILKNFDNLIVIYNHKLIKNKFNNKGFYLFDYFKPLNVFFGKEIKYSQIYKIKKYIELFNKNLKEMLIRETLIYLIIFILLFLAFTFIFEKKLRLIDSYLISIKSKAYEDDLTKVYNRKYLEETKTNPKTLAIIDLDNFKYINDTFGHKKGDEVLKYFAQLLKTYFAEDTIIRWGGDEFIILSEKDPKTIKNFTEKINHLIKDYQKTFDKHPKKELSISAGICSNPQLVYEEKFKNADLALYKVKKSKKGSALCFREIDYIKIEKS